MNGELLYSLVEVYNKLASEKLSLTMTRSAAQSLGGIYEEGAGISLQTAIYKTFDKVIRENLPNQIVTFPLRFSRRGVLFYYLALAEQTETGVHLLMLIKDDKRYKEDF